MGSSTRTIKMLSAHQRHYVKGTGRYETIT
jgi:hypothetical protein